MKINKKDVLITKVELKQNKENKAYLVIEFLDLEDGSNYQLIEKDIELMRKLNQMTKYKLDLKLSSSRYGLKLEIVNVIENLGGIK